MSAKVILVTGASSGIGRELCLVLAALGFRIVAAARRTEKLKHVCDHINKNNSAIRAIAVSLDVAGEESTIQTAVNNAWEAFGTIDVLINNAGIRGAVHSPLDWTQQEWNTVFDTNLTGLWLVAKHICKRMIDAKQKGSVINISSTAGVNRGKIPGGIAYITSKEGVNAVTKVMALELGVHNIRVNCICPGIFKSEITEQLMKKPWINTFAKRTVPLRTFGTSDPAMTSVVRYLIDDSSEYVTGNIFIVDAGATLTGIPIFSSL